MKNATYQDGILTVNGKRYTVEHIENHGEIDGHGHCLMILREEGDLFWEKDPIMAEWSFPEALENIEDYDWENTAFLKKVWV